MRLIFALIFIPATLPFLTFAQTVNPNFNQYKDNVVKELNGEKVLELQQQLRSLKNQLTDAADDAKEASWYKLGSKESQNELNKKAADLAERVGNVESQLLNEMKQAKTSTQVLTSANQFASTIASDLKSSKGPNVVGFPAGFSSAGHNSGVIENLNTMQKAAAQYFGLNSNSSYGLINGASMDGGINQRFEEAVKEGKLTAAVDKANFKTYGAVSINIGEWGGMMTTNKAVLLQDSPAGSYELKANNQAPSENPRTLAVAAQSANANVHIMLTEGGEIGLKEVLEYLNNQHKKGTKALVHLGIGYDPTNPSKDKGIRGASFLARHLALNPELIDSLEKSGVKFMAVDAASGRHYSSIKDYLKSNDWKTQLLKFQKASADINSEDFKKKKIIVSDLEEKLKNEADKEKKKQIAHQIGILKGEIALTENRVNSEAKISQYIGELSKVTGYKPGSGSFEKVAKASAATFESNKKSGISVDPKEAAKAATKGVK